MSREYRIALNRDILNQHFTSSPDNLREIVMFFNNIKMCARNLLLAAETNRSSKAGKYYFRRKTETTQMKENEI